MTSIDQDSAITQDWSWKISLLLAAVAVTLDVLILQSPVVWLGIAGAVALLAQFRSPISGLAVVVFTCGLANYSPFKAGTLSRLYPGNVAIAIFIIAWLARTKPWSAKSLFPPVAIRAPLMGLAVLTPISMLWSRLFPDHEVVYSFPHSDVSWAMVQASQFALLAVTICVPFAVLAGIKRWKDIENLVLMIGVVVAAGTVVTVAALKFGFGSDYEILGATRGYWEQPWDSSIEPLSALALPFLYAGVLFGRRSLSHYWLFCLLLPFCLLGAVLAFSRATWLMAFSGVLLVSASWLRSRVTPTYAIVISVIVSGIVAISGLVGFVSHFYNPNEVYGLERIYYYISALHLFASHPLLGVGAGNYQFFDRSYEGEQAGGIAHNQFLTAAAETGIVGLALLLWLVVAFHRIHRQLGVEGNRRNPHDWLRAAGSAFLPIWVMECLFQEAFFPTAAAGGGTHVMTEITFPWIFLGILLAACGLNQTAAPADS
ncbi:MAG: O-antigen ligase family protein [Acidobacteria bacterium]|nr:O-antigen ligase family protein [Acidobacteriota bacterium]